MSITPYLFAIALTPLTLVHALPRNDAMQGNASTGVACEIRSTPASGGVRLEAVAAASTGASGEYSFLIAKSGGGGSSNVTQGGEFTLRSGEEAVLGEVSLGLGGGARYEATLTLSWHGGQTSCRTAYPQQT